MPHFSLPRRSVSPSTSPSRPGRSASLRSAAAGLALGAAVIAAPSAQAHDSLVGSNPAADSVIQAAPAQLVLSFSGSVLPEGSRVAVQNPAGGSTAATPKVSGALVTVPFRASGPGVYAVTWRVTSADGHPVSGSYRFTLAGSTSAATTPAATLAPAAPSLGGASSQSTVKGPTTPTTNEPGDNQPVLIIVGSLVALAAIAGGYVIARRRMTSGRS